MAESVWPLGPIRSPRSLPVTRSSAVSSSISATATSAFGSKCPTSPCRKAFASSACSANDTSMSAPSLSCSGSRLVRVLSDRGPRPPPRLRPPPPPPPPLVFFSVLLSAAVFFSVALGWVSAPSEERPFRLPWLRRRRSLPSSLARGRVGRTPGWPPALVAPPTEKAELALVEHLELGILLIHAELIERSVLGLF